MLIVAGLLAAVGNEAAAQQPAGAAMRPASSGVYTVEQAAKGEEAYGANCMGCHNTAAHTGDAFMNGWAGRPLAELYGFISAAMPKTEPGSLSKEEYASIVAYILKLNGMPAGKQPLPADTAALGKIRIDSKKGL
jgi:mono/diheme cytochrome c family protein